MNLNCRRRLKPLLERIPIKKNQDASLWCNGSSNPLSPLNPCKIVVNILYTIRLRSDKIYTIKIYLVELYRKVYNGHEICIITGEMQEKTLPTLDFDAAMALARRDPEAFEQYRQGVIDALIASAPERSRLHLRRLQWRIDQERQRASNPTAACVKLYRMMWDSFAGECGLIDTIRNAHNYPHRAESLQPKAEVLAFTRASTVRDRSDS